MDERGCAKRTIRIYRHVFAEILDIVAESGSSVARDVMEPLRRTQWRLDKLKAMAPASLDPKAPKHVVALEEFR